MVLSYRLAVHTAWNSPLHGRQSMLQGHLGVEAHGPLGLLWVSLGLICFYTGLIWLNSLLGTFLTPLFIIPATWLMDHLKRRKAKRQGHEVAQ
jgi:hypothetical protein